MAHDDTSRPATVAEFLLLAELVQKNSEETKEFRESIEDQMHEGFTELKTMMRSIGKTMSWHEDKLQNHAERIEVLETAA